MTSSPCPPCHDLTKSKAFQFLGIPSYSSTRLMRSRLMCHPPPPQPSSPLLASKQPRHNCKLVDHMWGLLWMGTQHLDMLRGAQMAAQEASGVMAAAMLQHQGAMREVSSWESEVEGVMREMARVVDGEGSGV